ncbi:hypothetical protein [Brevundimonas diminuta]|uniref:hypothetical protein n=1 Tax=Brevundimonas diminuta TaxID=293 RepID=UPI00320AD887
MSDLPAFPELTDRQRERVAEKIVTRALLAAILRTHPEGQAILDGVRQDVINPIEGANIDPAMVEALRASLWKIEEKVQR